MRLLAFGDSITYGAWDTKGGWVERLKKIAHATTVESNGKNKIQVINLGIGGNTSTSLLARMESEIKSRVSANWPFVFIIAIGTNDGRTSNSEPEVPVEKFADNVNQIVTIAEKYTDKIIFLGIPPIGSASLDFKDQIYSDDTIETYSDVVERIANGRGVTFVPIRPLFESSESKNLFAYDSLHPGNEGHELIVEAILPHLENLGIKF